MLCTNNLGDDSIVVALPTCSTKKAYDIPGASHHNLYEALKEECTILEQDGNAFHVLHR